MLTKALFGPHVDEFSCCHDKITDKKLFKESGVYSDFRHGRKAWWQEQPQLVTLHRSVDSTQRCVLGGLASLHIV